MPKFLSPQKISAHRIAVKALYRALLIQCRASPLPAVYKTQAENLVRYRFKEQIHLQSLKRIRVHLCGAYDGLDKLDASIAGDGDSTTYLVDLLNRVPAYAKDTPSLPDPVLPPPDYDYKRGDIMNRPRPLEELSGRRHVPRLVNANGIPVLRIKKPQPAHLSAFIARRINRRQNTSNIRWALEEKRYMAQQEDSWDDIVEVTAHGRIERDAGRWETHIMDALRENMNHHISTQRQLEETAQKMQAIVDAEQELLRAERLERRRMAVARRAELAKLPDQSTDSQLDRP